MKNGACGVLRHLPNLLSGARIAAAPALIALALARHEQAFTVLLIGALLSDVLDGLLARRLGLQSSVGASLDSIGDVTTLIAAAIGIGVFHPEVFAEHAWAVWTVLGGWLCVAAIALVRYRRLSSFHTYLSKAAGYALGFFLIALFLFAFVAPLFYAAVAINAMASVEELALLRCLPEWRSDVRGLWWVLRAAR